MSQSKESGRDFSAAELVTMRFKIELTTGSGEKIYEGEGTHELPGLLVPRELTSVMKRFVDEWKYAVAEPVFASLDAFRRERYERVRPQMPLIDYPAEIDFMKDAEDALRTYPISDLADRERLARIRRGDMPPWG